MVPAKVLVVDDSEARRLALCAILEKCGFETTAAADLTEALRYISSPKYDVLSSDLHMPGARDGFTVVSAIRHVNPDTVTLLLSSFLELSAVANAILMQTDEIMVKPMNVPDLIDAIRQRLAKGPLHKRKVETLATILKRSTEASTADWYRTVEEEESIKAVPLSREAHCGYLPQLFCDLARRLQVLKPLGTKELKSEATSSLRLQRRKQGYTASMMVGESCILQVTIFHTLQKNLSTIDFSALLFGVMTIAHEVDLQSSQAMRNYMAESFENELPRNSLQRSTKASHRHEMGERSRADSGSEPQIIYLRSDSADSCYLRRLSGHV